MTFRPHFLPLHARVGPVAAARPRVAARPRLALAWTLAAALLLGALPAAFAQAADPPGRVARLNLVEGAVSFAPAESAGDAGWTPAVPNRPLTEGDRIWTAPGSRSELHIGATTLRMGEQTSVDLAALGDDETQLRLPQGTLQLRVRSADAGQRIEVNTPNLAFVISAAGDYRIDADPASNTTRVVVHSGHGTAHGDGGTAMDLDRGQQATFAGTGLAAGGAPPQADAFDAWARSRDQLEERSIAAQHIPREVVGYQQLDAYGDWQQDPAYGAVWLPRAVPAGWAPYRVGHWSWIAPWGWTWIDDAPWGFAPFHYGRWAQIGPRWGWVPGRIAPRPVYAPALVAFIGGQSGGASWNVGIGPGRRAQPAFGWFPLAPGEVFRPGYRVSPRYISSVNQNIAVNRLAADAAPVHRYQRHPGAVSAARADDFTHGRPFRAQPQAVQAADLSRAHIAPGASPMPPRPERQGGPGVPHPPSARALPPPALAARPVVASEFARDRTRPAEPGLGRNRDTGQTGAPVREGGRPGAPVEPDKHQTGERRQAGQARIAEPPPWQRGGPPALPNPQVGTQFDPDKHQRGERRQAEQARIAQPPPVRQAVQPVQPIQPADDGRGQRAAPRPEPVPPTLRTPRGEPVRQQREAREPQPQLQPEPPPITRQPPMARPPDPDRQDARRAWQAQQQQQQQQQQQVQRQQQMARQADEQRAQQAQQQAQRNAQQQQVQQQIEQQQHQMQRQQPMGRPADPQQRQDQPRAQQGPPPQQQAAPPQQPAQARQPPPETRGGERNKERDHDRRQRGGPGPER